MDVKDSWYEGESIQLGGKIRHIKYTFKGLKLIAKKFGSVAKAFNDMQTMDTNFTTETMDNLAILLHAGLIHEDPALTIDETENFLTMGNMTKIFTSIMKAFNGSTPEPEEGSTDDQGE